MFSFYLETLIWRFLNNDLFGAVLGGGGGTEAESSLRRPMSVSCVWSGLISFSLYVHPPTSGSTFFSFAFFWNRTTGSCFSSDFGCACCNGLGLGVSNVVVVALRSPERLSEDASVKDLPDPLSDLSMSRSAFLASWSARASSRFCL